MKTDEMNREKLLEELSQYQFVPGHGPDYTKMTDEELRKQLEFFRRIFEEEWK